MAFIFRKMAFISIESRVSREWFINKQIYDSCTKVNATVPPEVVAYFKGSKPDAALAESSILVDENDIQANAQPFVSEVCGGFKIDIRGLTKDIIHFKALTTPKEKAND